MHFPRHLFIASQPLPLQEVTNPGKKYRPGAEKESAARSGGGDDDDDEEDIVMSQVEMSTVCPITTATLEDPVKK